MMRSFVVKESSSPVTVFCLEQDKLFEEEAVKVPIAA
jgi:hypothetical protein